VTAMTHVTVTRVVVALTGVFIAAALAFGWLANRGAREPEPAPVVSETAPVPPGGLALFERHCGMCHESADLRDRIRAAPDREALRRQWLDFLSSHGDASEEEDRTIVEALMAGAMGGGRVFRPGAGSLSHRAGTP